jgi:GNAT superfamily N-acetyltransferase
MIQEEPPSAPAALTDRHAVDAFDSGEKALDDWLRRHAKPNQVSGASRTFVICRGTNVIGYYALAAGAITSNEAPGRLRRNMPEPIPVIVLGRLAVHRTEQNKRLGSLLLRDAILRTQQAARTVGIAEILVHAISEDAKRFYQHWGFVECPSNALTLVARLKDLDALLV